MTILKPITEREKQEFKKAHNIEVAVGRLIVYCVQHGTL